jgi:hypothetical protein
MFHKLRLIKSSKLLNEYSLLLLSINLIYRRNSNNKNYIELILKTNLLFHMMRRNWNPFGLLICLLFLHVYQHFQLENQLTIQIQNLFNKFKYLINFNLLTFIFKFCSNQLGIDNQFRQKNKNGNMNIK